jgi:hypothetical protein
MKRSPLLSRRALARLLTPLALALMLVLQVNTASAGIGWCRTDPLITVNGRTGHVYLDSTDAMMTSATGPILLEIRVPVGSTTAAVPLDSGFGYGYSITFKEDAELATRGPFSEVRVSAFVPAKDSSLPVKVTFHADRANLRESIKTSTANTWILTRVVKI